MRKTSSDLVVLIAGVALSMAAAWWLHGLWYHGLMVRAFGDAPLLNPAYPVLSPVAQAVPYAAAGAVGGLVLGIGSPRARSVLSRAGGLAVAASILATRDASLALRFFVPLGMAAFCVSVALSAIQAWSHSES